MTNTNPHNFGFNTLITQPGHEQQRTECSSIACHFVPLQLIATSHHPRWQGHQLWNHGANPAPSPKPGRPTRTWDCRGRLVMIVKRVILSHWIQWCNDALRWLMLYIHVASAKYNPTDVRSWLEQSRFLVRFLKVNFKHPFARACEVFKHISPQILSIDSLTNLTSYLMNLSSSCTVL